MDPVSLLPPIHIQTASRHQSQSKYPPASSRPTRRNRHCADTDCFVWNPYTYTTQADRWAAFDAFDPREVDDYAYHYTSTAPPASSAESRRIKRAAELKTRAKARLMPPFDPCRRRSGSTTTSTTRRGRQPQERDAYRTPSVAPNVRTPRTPVCSRRLFEESGSENEGASSFTPATPTHTPASTIASWSPAPTPCHLPLRFHSPSP